MVRQEEGETNTKLVRLCGPQHIQNIKSILIVQKQILYIIFLKMNISNKLLFEFPKTCFLLFFCAK